MTHRITPLLLSLFWLLGLLFSGAELLGQVLKEGPKTLVALPTQSAIKVDGFLDDPAWAQAEKAVDFITTRPEPGLPARFASTVQIVYSNEGLYVGARLYDSHPDSILQEITDRDQLGNTDFFGVIIDPYQSGLQGFEFLTTPAAVQFDAKVSPDGEDRNWDAVWDCKAAITPEGWEVELFIPYSAIRFPSLPTQAWTLNFVRMVQRHQEQSFWSFVNPQVDGLLNQSGLLTQLENIRAPFRLQLTPFATMSGLLATDAASAAPASTATSLGGGLDLKLGLSDAFTLDMTLVPDFSEARSDDNILNLGPFEQEFDEQRAFFTEGTELFNKGGLFYSRRIGGSLYDAGAAYRGLEEGERVLQQPSRPQLVNATKISGRSVNGTGLGFFNAIEQAAWAEVSGLDDVQRRVKIHPRTNYNVLVIDQNLPNNSSVTLINTNVLREGNATDANVTGLLFDLHNQKNVFAIRGNGTMSHRFTETETISGHKASLSVAKISGNWQFNLRYNEESDTYDTNDLGILFANNERTYAGNLSYDRYKPFLKGFFLNGGAGLFMKHERRFVDNAFVENNIETWVYAQTKHFWRINLWLDQNPVTYYDYFEPRVQNRYLSISPYRNVGGWMGTDNRKKWRFNGNFNHTNFHRDQLREEFSYFLGLRYRLSDRFSSSLSWYKGQEWGDLGYVNQENLPQGTAIYMGRRHTNESEFGWEAKYSFSANMSLNLRLRHYWARVNYRSFHLLNENGELEHTTYQDKHDVDFDAFNIDLIYRWRFARGSDIFLVYKTNASAFDENTQRNYATNFRDLWQQGQAQHLLSLKVIYWLDYAALQPTKN